MNSAHWNSFIKKYFLLIFLFCLNIQVFSQKKDSSQIDSVAKNATVLLKKTVADSIKQRKLVKKKSDFHFFSDVFLPIDSTKRKKLPKIALYRSLILPGWGQATNHQYWLIPIVWAAAAGGIYSIAWNAKQYTTYKGYLDEAYTAYTKDPTSTYPLTISGQVYNVSYTQILPAVTAYHRYRDLSKIVFILGWGLQAVQVNVQAHLRTFDMSNNISLNFEPSFQMTPYGSALGISARFVLK